MSCTKGVKMRLGLDLSHIAQRTGTVSFFTRNGYLLPESDRGRSILPTAKGSAPIFEECFNIPMVEIRPNLAEYPEIADHITKPNNKFTRDCITKALNGCCQVSRYFRVESSIISIFKFVNDYDLEKLSLSENHWVIQLSKEYWHQTEVP